MKIFLVSYDTLSAVIAAEGPAAARDLLQNEYPGMLDNVDRRTIRCGELKSVELTEQLDKPTILKVVN